MRRWILIGAAIAALLWTGAAVRKDVHGLTLVMRAAEVGGAVRHLADLDSVRITERTIRADIKGLSVRSRVYAPTGHARHTVLLVSGLHPAGIDEPRLMALARRLAEANVVVVTPDIQELSHFEITPVLTDRIEAAAEWLAAEPGLTPTGRIGLMGISFSGGLAVVAAGRPSLKDHLLYVFSFGGHDDLGRVLDYFCTGIEGLPLPPGAQGGLARPPRPPHDYGVAVVLLNVADHLVPPEQVAALRDGVRRFLWTSYLDVVDKPQAAREFLALRELASRLPEPSATLLGYVNDRDVVHLGAALLPYVGPYAAAPALSPSRSPAPGAPVFLLHGRDDNVIPAAESQHLADRLRGRVPVRLLMTDLISHAEADQPAHAADVLRLAGFWGDLLDH